MGVSPAGPASAGLNSNVPDETFTASRWTKGNLFFPTRIVVSPLRVSRVRRRLFGSTEESISISQVASVKISTGVLWSDIVIESSGGTDPITSHGHRKVDALRIRDLVESFQSARRAWNLRRTPLQRCASEVCAVMPGLVTMVTYGGPTEC
ncbi:MAG: hypothetical protein WBW53_11860 [Terriglobales bacterium]